MTDRRALAEATVVYRLPGADAVDVRRDVPYTSPASADAALDVYSSSDADDSLHPAVIFVSGYRDAGYRKFLGCRFKEMGAVTSWARLVAASGMAAITYSNREPVADLDALLDYVTSRGAALGVDRERIGVWASSGSVPTALAMLMRDARHAFRCAALYYGYTLDAVASTTVSDAAAQFGFANPCAGRSVGDLRADVPIQFARAGRDEMPGLNDALDRFVSDARRRGLPVNVAHHPDGPHAFDILDPSPTSRELIAGTLAFLHRHLLE